MKKIILLAAFGVAALVNAKISDVKVPEKQTAKTESKFQLCGVFVNYYDEKGNWAGSQWFLTDAPSLSSCQAYQSFVKWNLTQAGFNLTIE